MFAEAGGEFLNFPADIIIENPEASGDGVRIERGKQIHLVTPNSLVYLSEPFCATHLLTNGLRDLVLPGRKLM